MGLAERAQKPISDNSGLKQALDRLEKLTVNLARRPAGDAGDKADTGATATARDMQVAMAQAFSPAEQPAEPSRKPETSAGVAESPAPTLLSMKQAAAITTLSVSSIKRMMAAGTFPQPVRLGEGRIAFVDAEIHAWIRARIAARR